MKLTLINPWFGNEEWQWHYPPLELGFLGTYIQNNAKNIEVEIIDPIAQKLNINEVINRTKNSEIVGLTCYTERRFKCFELAEKIKLKNSDCKLVLGGPHATFLDTSIMKYYHFIDVIVRGEGENALLEIVEEKELKRIPNITWRNKNKIIRNNTKHLEHNIDAFYVDYSLLPRPEKYVSDYALPYKYKNLQNIYITATRGCPYTCTFCGNLKLWKRVWRAPSPQLLINRIKDIVNIYDIEYFRFCDAFFTANEKWTITFLKLLKNTNLNIHFGIDSGINISEKVLNKLSESGCLRITFGIESGSDRILKRINKPTTKSMIMKTIKKSRKLGIWTRGDFIFGWNGETKEDFKETLSIIKLLDDIELNILQIFPGTTLYEELKMKKDIDDSFWFDNPSNNSRYFDIIPHYCKEKFKSADYSIKELRTSLKRASIYHTLHIPTFILKKYGIKDSLKLISHEILKKKNDK